MRLQVRYAWTALLALCFAACDKGPAASAPGSTELGRSPEAPVVTCGPQESRAYVARTFRCPDGSNPLGGDLEASERARRGSMPAPRGDHILDRYDVPCAGQPVTVYVDQYGCPEYEKRLAESQQGTAQGNALLKGFQQGDLQGTLDHCRALGPNASGDEQGWCVALIPASLYGQGRYQEGLAAVTSHCTRLPAASTSSDARAAQLALTVVALAQLAHGGQFQAEEEERIAIVESWLHSCSVPREQLTKTLDVMQQE